MHLLDKLFGKASVTGNPYLDAGMALTAKLFNSLDLNDWKNEPISYTPEEVSSIDRELSSFGSIVNDKMGRPAEAQARFHPDVLPHLQRVLIARALEQLAGGSWKYLTPELPYNWRSRCSTYLKAWACYPNPSAIEDVSRLLIRASLKNEARESLQVLLLFPSYARTYFGDKDESGKLTNTIVENAQQALCVEETAMRTSLAIAALLLLAFGAVSLAQQTTLDY